MKVEASDDHQDLGYYGCHKNLIVLLDLVLKKITTNTPSHGTQFDTALGNRSFRVPFSLTAVF